MSCCIDLKKGTNISEEPLAFLFRVDESLKAEEACSFNIFNLYWTTWCHITGYSSV
jgi:hypothetical protein